MEILFNSIVCSVFVSEGRPPSSGSISSFLGVPGHLERIDRSPHRCCLILAICHLLSAICYLFTDHLPAIQRDVVCLIGLNGPEGMMHTHACMNIVSSKVFLLFCIFSFYHSPCLCLRTCLWFIFIYILLFYLLMESEWNNEWIGLVWN